jgi:hypothetical protein
VANVAIGIIGSALVLRRLIAQRLLTPEQAGFRTFRRTILTAVLGLGAGLTFYWLQGRPTITPIALLNVFTQVWPVSTAEVLVCWAVGAAIVHAVWTGPARKLVAAVCAAVLFGVYHFAHSPPFNSPRMILVLTAVGLATGVFFFVVREVYGTIAFHNGLALYGVAGALDASGDLKAFERPLTPLWGMALGALVLLAALHRRWFRSFALTGPERPAPGRVRR